MSIQKLISQIVNFSTATPLNLTVLMFQIAVRLTLENVSGNEEVKKINDEKIVPTNHTTSAYLLSILEIIFQNKYCLSSRVKTIANNLVLT